MRLSVLAVGKLKSGPEKHLAEDYRERIGALGRKAGIGAIAVAEMAESQAATAPLRIAEEAKFFAERMAPGASRIVLDERGRNLDSSGFAAILRAEIDAGAPEIAFLIGGPDGHGEETRRSARLVLALGAMTWPHRLVRIMLLEQIYRAVTIMVNHPYHRS
jgi:23S rRNA (pseudouridine1915-N3)-methyltransferase